MPNEAANLCPPANEWQQLLEEKLPAAASAKLTEHLEHCPACQQLVGFLADGSLRDLCNLSADPLSPELRAIISRLKFEQHGETQAAPIASPSLDPDLAFLDRPREPGHLGRLAHYEIHSLVGRGGMGVVLKAFDESLHRIVAIKTMTAHLAGIASARHRFLREARAAAAIRDEHVVAIHAVEGETPVPYLVMEFVQGESLQDLIDRQGALDTRSILRIGIQAATGLAAAHKQGLVHRDIKPANILLENGVQRVKLTDFGLARAADDASISTSGVIAGTPQYMSPEQARGDELDERSDLFSLGSVLYAMATGQAPYRGSSNLAVLRRVCDEVPKPVRQVNPDVPDWLCAVIERLHAKRPEDRYSSAREVADVLGQRLAYLTHGGKPPQQGAAVTRPMRREKGRTGWAWLLWTFLGILLVFALVFATFIAPVRDVEMRPSVPPDYRSPKNQGELVTKHEPPRPFALIDRDGDVKELFESLAQAAEAADNGATIEVRANGVVAGRPMIVGKKALRIVAAPKHRPILALDEPFKKAVAMIESDGPLTLEGLEFWDAGLENNDPNINRQIVRAKGVLRVLNCRMTVAKNGACVWLGAEGGEIRNSLFIGANAAVSAIYWTPVEPSKLLDIENCGLLGPIEWVADRGEAAGATLRMRNSTSIARYGLVMHLPHEAQPAERRIVENEHNVWNAERVCFRMFAKPVDKTLDLDQARLLMNETCNWKERSNLYGHPEVITDFRRDAQASLEGPAGLEKLERWLSVLGLKSTGSLQAEPVHGFGQHRFRILDDAKTSPGIVGSRELQLSKESPGRKLNGVDIGIDGDTAGPGPNFDRWRTTAEYSAWQERRKR